MSGASGIPGVSGPHFSSAELACHHCGINKCTQGIVDVLEALRSMAVVRWTKKYNRPASEFPGMNVHDAYRCKAHNATTKNAATSSQHPQGTAADVSVEGLTAAELEEDALKMNVVRGIGRDDHANYIHVDGRPGPHLARWCYTPGGATCDYYSPITKENA